MISLCAVFLLSPTLTFAANPASPFSPSDNVTDPNCLPTDSNCYVSITSMTFVNATSTNLITTSATSTNFYSTLINAITAAFTNFTATNATTTNLIATNATSTNFFSTALQAITAAFTTLSTTGTTTLATTGGRVSIGTTTPNHTLDVQGNIGLASSGYINFGVVDSTSGYGFRDNAGAIEYKNSNGGWTSFASAGAGGGQLLAVFSTSTAGTNITVNFNGSSNSSPSYSGGVLTLPSNASHIVVETWGAGGGGGGSNSGATGGTGGTTCFGTNSTACTSPALSATGGTGGTSSGGGSVAGTGTGGDINLTGGASAGLSASNASLNYSAGGAGGSAPLGGGGGGSTWSSSGTTGAAYGGGGAGGGIYSANSSCAAGGGGAGGGYARKLISNPSGTYYYTVGSGGVGTVAGSACGVGSQYGGGDGGSGGITISIYTSGVSNGSVGSGLTGYLPFYNSSGTNLSATSSIFLSTTGNVGIGTTSPISSLFVQGSGSTSPFTVASSTGATLFSILANGNVGIGTSTPGSKLDIWGNFTVGTSSVSSFFVNTATGRVGIGTTNPQGKLQVEGSLIIPSFETATNVISFRSGIPDGTNVGIRAKDVAASGNRDGLEFFGHSGFDFSSVSGSSLILRITQAGNATLAGTLTQNSDQRLKTNITPLSSSYGLDSILKLNPITYTWKDNVHGTSTQIGFLAQQVQSFFPELVTRSSATTTDTPDGTLALNYINLIAPAIKAIQDMNSVFNATNALNASSTIFSYYQGTTTPAITVGATGTLSVGNSLIEGVVARFQNATGYCDINPTTTSLTCSSDERLKKNILSLDATSTFDKFIQLNPVTYNWTSETSTSSTSTHAGFIAQQVETLFPDLVATDEQGMKSVSYAGFIPYIVESIKSLVVEVKALTVKVASFANLVETDKVKSKSICLENNGAETCISKEKLDAILLLLGETSTSSSEPVVSPDTSTTTVEVSISTEPVASSTPEVAPVEETVETEVETVANPATEETPLEEVVETETVIEPTTETTTP